MFLGALEVTCFLPNSTFNYNPLSQSGNLEATFIADDGSDAIDICHGLDGHLARALVEFVEMQNVSSNLSQDTRHQALSDNFYFKNGAALNVVLKAESLTAHELALETEQANFVVEILDMDAKIEQTLSLYAVQSFNFDECLYDMQVYVSNTLTVEADLRNCDVSGSIYERAIEGGNMKDDYVIGLVFVEGIGEMQAPIGISVWNAEANIVDRFRYTFDCEKLALEDPINGRECQLIVEYLSSYCGFIAMFKMEYKLSSRDLRFELRSYVSFVESNNVNGCINATFMLGSTEMSITYYISDDPRCIMPVDHKTYVQGNLESMEELAIEAGLFYNESVSLLNGQQKIIIECSKQSDEEACEKLMLRYALIDSLNMRFRIYYSFPDGTYDFYSTSPIRNEYCFLSISSYLFVDSYKLNSGGVRIELKWTGSEMCRRQIAIRTSLQFRMYKRLQVDGRVDELENEPIIELELRDTFSIDNKTFMFTCDECKQALKQAGTAIAQHIDAAIIIIGEEEVRIDESFNQMYDSNPNIFMGIGIALGVVFSIGSFFANFSVIGRLFRKRKANIAAIN